MAKKSWGLPYKGSKNIIAKDIVNALPSGERLVDLFAGGCAITDYALKNTNKFSRFLVNDLNGWLPQTYVKALAGGFRDEYRWISRKDFFRLKDTDPYVNLCFSFGNNLTDYMYATELEPYKRALHHIIFWENYGPMEELCPQVVDIIKEYCKGKDRKGRRLASGNAVADHIKQKGSVEYCQSNPMFRAVKVKWSPEIQGMKDYVDYWKSNHVFQNECYNPEINSECYNPDIKAEAYPLQTMPTNLTHMRSLQSLERLERLQKLESLQRLERLQNIADMTERASLGPQDMLIETSNISYADYAYRDGDVVYCDPPYKNTKGYVIKFDSDAFWEWARTRNYPLYVSEYQAPADFVSIWSREKRSLLCSTGPTAPRIENLFLHKKWI